MKEQAHSQFLEQVHRFHPPLMYGRVMQGVEPDAAEGAVLYAVQNSSGRPAFAFATYKCAFHIFL